MSTMAAALAFVLAVAAVRWLLRQRPSAQRHAALKTLLQYCDGDDELASRLVIRETERDEDLSLAQAANRATDRLKRDRR